MDLSPYQRLELFWQSKGLKTATAFAETVPGLTVAALSAMKSRGSAPSTATLRLISLVYPKLNPNYILYGVGEIDLSAYDVTDGHRVNGQKSYGVDGVPYMGVVKPTYEELVKELSQLRHQLATKDGRIAALEENQAWLREAVTRKPEASADAADLYAEVDAIAADLRKPFAAQHEIGYKQAARVYQLETA